jgi:quinol monooxygenase YgiN
MWGTVISGWAMIAVFGAPVLLRVVISGLVDQETGRSENAMQLFLATVTPILAETKRQTKGEFAMTIIIARISSTAAGVEQLREILTALVGPSRNEDGCFSYELFQDDDNPQDFITVEHWADDQAADAHMATPHVAAAIAQVGSLLSQPPLIHRFTQLA